MARWSLGEMGVYSVFLYTRYRMFIKYCFFFEDFEIYSGLWSNTSAAEELAEFRKITTF